MILQLAVSRQREYLADATAAELLGEGRPLAEALESLERGVEAVPMEVNPATASLYIANPLWAPGWPRSSRRIRRSSQRIERLREADRRSRDPTRSASEAGVRLSLTRSSGQGSAVGGVERRPRWLRRRRRSTSARTTSSSPGRRASLPERERTKHVHRLHPYLGKFIPQLVEALLERHVRRAAASSTRSPARGRRSCRRSSPATTRPASTSPASTRCSSRSRRARYNLDALRRDLLWAHAEAEAFEPRGRYPRDASAYVRAWYAPAAAEELLHFRSLVDQVGSADVLRVVLARSARSARRTTHFDLDFPREPQLEPYWCHKHRRECRPVEAARRFLLRYTLDTLDRIESFAAVACATGASRGCCTATRARSTSEGPYDGVVTSPPYPGLIDYHEQHRYAYELLGLDERRDLELGRPARGHRAGRRSRSTSTGSPTCSRTRVAR